MSATVRSVDVRLNAMVSKYVADMRMAGRETDKAFARSQGSIQGVNRELGIAKQRLDSVNDSGKAVNATLGRGNTRMRVYADQAHRLSGELDGLRNRNLALNGGGRDSIVTVGNNSVRTGRQLDTVTGRVGLLAEALAVLGPAAVPISSVAVPAIAGLVNELGFAVLGAGATVLAFQGVGDALTALDKAHLDPTVENIAAARVALRQLGPDAESLVSYLYSLRDEWTKLRDTAAGGILPGVEDGLKALESRIPQVEGLVKRLSNTTGEIIESGAESLASDRWDDFFTMLRTEARPTLNGLSDSVGNVAHGAAELWVAFAPMERDFTGWLKRSTEDFDDWATRLSSTDGFGDFLAYVRQNGPQVAATAGAIADALIQVVEAASPLGGPVLQGLEVVAKVIAAIADSDFGTPIFTGLAAMALLTRATKLWDATSETAAARFLTGQVQGAAGVRTLTADLAAMRAEYGRVNAVQAVTLSGLSNTSGAAQRTRATLGALGRTAGLVTGLAVATSGVADGMGLSNTMSLALMGTIAGPWGAAIGGGIGAVMDFAAANDDAADAVRDLDRKLADASSFTDYANQLTSSKGTMQDYLDGEQKAVESFSGWLEHAFSPGGFKTNLDVLFGGFDDSQLGKTLDAYDKVTEKQGDMQLVGSLLAKQMGVVSQSVDNTTITTDQWEQALSRATPAMSALGISLDDLIAGVADGSIVQLAGQIQAYTAKADSAKGRTQAVEDALAGLDNIALSAADSADALKDSLDALLSPGLNLSAATDQWVAGLQHLKDSLDKSGRSLVGQTDAARTNREAIRDQVTNLMDLAGAQADAGASGAKLSRQMRDGRQAILDAGQAAGLSRKQVADYLNTLGLTPKEIQTWVKANTSQAEQSIRDVQRALSALTSKTIYVTTIRRGTSVVEPHAAVPAGADGMTVPGARHPYGDKTLIWAAPGEEVITNRNGEADRFRADRASGRIPAYADGGKVGGESPRNARWWFAQRGGDKDVLTMHEALAALRDFTFNVKSSSKDVRTELRDLRQSIREAGGTVTDRFDRISTVALRLADRSEDLQKAIEKEKQQRQQLVQAEKSYEQQLRAQFMTSLAPSGEDTYSTPTVALPDNYDSLSVEQQQAARLQQAQAQASLDAIFARANRQAQTGQWRDTLQTDIQGSRRRERLLAILADMGLKGGAYRLASEELSSDDLKELTGSRSDLRDFIRLVQTRNRLNERRAAASGDVAYGKKIDATNDRLDRLHGAVENVGGRIKHLEDTMQDAIEDAAPEFAAALAGAKKKAHTRANGGT